MSREDLAKRQLEFVAALATDACVFEGVPSERMLTLRESMVSRPISHAGRLAPALRDWLGKRFEVSFRRWLSCGPQTGGPLSELLGFAAGVSDPPEAVAIELLELRIKFRRQARSIGWG